MGTAVRRHAAAGFALIGATAIAVTPIAPPTPPAIHVAQLETRLAGSVANIPVNLVYALANVPNSEVQAVNQIAGSLLHTGTWMVVSATNIWGSDAADPGHWESLTSLLLPFPAMSSVLGRQLAMLAAAELPVNDACDAEGCFPVAPTGPITGVTGLDAVLQIVAALTGLVPNALVQSWFKVPLSELLSGYTFPEQLVSPSGPAYAGFGFPGTYPDPVTGQPLLPWSGQTFTWDPLEPFTAFYNSLTATPEAPADAVKLPTGEQVVRAVQSLLAGIVVSFNPFVPGSPFWLHELPIPTFLSSTAIVKFIGDIYPGNAVIDEWLTAAQNGTANGPTDAQIEFSIKSLQSGLFTLRPDAMAKVNALLAGIDPVLPDIVSHSGLLGSRDWIAMFDDIGKLLNPSAPGTTAVARTSTDSQTVSSSDTPATPLAADQPEAGMARVVPLAATGRSLRTRPAARPVGAAASQAKADPVAAETLNAEKRSAANEPDNKPAEPTADHSTGVAGVGKGRSARTGGGAGEPGKAGGRHRAS